MNIETIRTALPVDFESIIGLLEECELPVSDLSGKDMDNFLVAENGERVVGCVAVERHGGYGLLRSLAVKDSFRGKRIGARLIAAAEEKNHDLRELYLLTTTVPKFFKRHSYITIEQDSVPEAIQQTREFSQICPASSVCMVKRMDS
jgi:amino-acid N-acetyltransferase